MTDAPLVRCARLRVPFGGRLTEYEFEYRPTV